MSSEKTYTAKDIERYHMGGMTPAEQHQLEKAALDDPMLADALEGYRHTTAAANELETLQKKLQHRVTEKNKRRLFSFDQQWLKIAALFVLIAGGGWLVLQTFSGRDTDLATSGAEKMEKANQRKNTDSTITVQRTPPTFITDTLVRGDEVVASGTARSREKTLPTASPSLVSPPTLQEVAGNEEKAEAAAATGSDAADKNNPAGIVAFKSNAPANTRREAADTGQHAADLAQTNSTGEEVVAATARMQPAKVRKLATVEIAEPQGGWQVFEKYINENRHLAIEKNQPFPLGDSVALRFSVDQDGRPVNITVEKSLCAKCDEEAIRLLKEGPKWKGKNGRVKIPFSP